MRGELPSSSMGTRSSPTFWPNENNITSVYTSCTYACMVNHAVTDRTKIVLILTNTGFTLSICAFLKPSSSSDKAAIIYSHLGSCVTTGSIGVALNLHFPRLTPYQPLSRNLCPSHYTLSSVLISDFEVIVFFNFNNLYKHYIAAMSCTLMTYLNIQGEVRMQKISPCSVESCTCMFLLYTT